MVNPSDTYSDIGDFGAGEAGWWFGKPEAGHPGLQQKLTDLGVEVIHRGTTPPEQSEYAPEASAAYYNETSEVLHLGDGTAWNAQATWGANPTFTAVDADSASVTNEVSAGSVDTGAVNNVQYIDTESQLNSVLSTSTTSDPAVHLIINSDITFTSVLDWSNLPHGSKVEGVGRPTLSFEHGTSTAAIPFDSQHSITFEKIRFECPTSSFDLIFFNGTNFNSYKFRFVDCYFDVSGGGRAVASNNATFSHIFENCEFRGLSALAYVQLGGTHNQFRGCRFLNIPNGSFGMTVPDGGPNGHAWVVEGTKFGGGDTGSGIDWSNNHGLGASYNAGTIHGCTFENLNRTSGSGEFGIRSSGFTTITGCMFGKLANFVEIGYRNTEGAITSILNCQNIGEGVLDYYIDASNGNNASAWTDRFDLAINDPNDLVSGMSDSVGRLNLLSTPPSSPSAGDWYLDDGTNTASANVAVRVYDGTAWVDQN